MTHAFSRAFYLIQGHVEPMGLPLESSLVLQICQELVAIQQRSVKVTRVEPTNMLFIPVPSVMVQGSQATW